MATARTEAERAPRSERLDPRPGVRLNNEQRRRLTKAILAEFEITEALQLVVELGLGWAEPYSSDERGRALGLKGLTTEEALAKVSADLRAASEDAPPR
ncbi:MAG: hypothetical protein ACRDI2_09555 [Chloroflexota bacterium]